MGVVKNGFDCHRKGCLAGIAAVAVLQAGAVGGGAVGTPGDAIPSGLFQVFNAGLLGGESLENGYNVHDFTASGCGLSLTDKRIIP